MSDLTLPTDLAAKVGVARRVVALAAAGMSAGSGVSTLRGVDGLWLERRDQGEQWP
jgi:NAD-dependent SIR2 family protein deacetylase